MGLLRSDLFSHQLHNELIQGHSLELGVFFGDVPKTFGKPDYDICRAGLFVFHAASILAMSRNAWAVAILRTPRAK